MLILRSRKFNGKTPWSVKEVSEILDPLIILQGLANVGEIPMQIFQILSAIFCISFRGKK